MNLFATTCISGLQDIVRKYLTDDLAQTSITAIYDGMIFYKTSASISDLRKLRYVNNTFLVLKIIHEKDMSSHELTRQIIDDHKIDDIPKDILKDVKNFRIVISKENVLTAIDNHNLIKIENYFSKILNLKINRANPDMEVWIITRSEGFTFVGIRVTKHASYEKTLHKGELHPQIVNIMCRLPDIQPTDAVYDPFAGYGAIPLECAKYFRTAKIFAGEKDKHIYLLLKDKLSKTKVVVGKWDGLNNSSLTNESIDKIITDPPWGQFREISEIDNFYFLMLKEFERLLKPDGSIVLLTSQKDLLKSQLEKTNRLILSNEYSILLSGKKSGIFIVKKITPAV